MIYDNTASSNYTSHLICIRQGHLYSFTCRTYNSHEWLMKNSKFPPTASFYPKIKVLARALEKNPWAWKFNTWYINWELQSEIIIYRICLRRWMQYWAVKFKWYYECVPLGIESRRRKRSLKADTSVNELQSDHSVHWDRTLNDFVSRCN